MPYGTVVGYQESSIDSKGFGIPEVIQDLRAHAHKALEAGDVVTFMAAAMEKEDGTVGVILNTVNPATFAGPKTVGVALADFEEGELGYFRISGIVPFAKTADTGTNKYVKPANGSNALTADSTEQVTSIGLVLGEYVVADGGSYDVQLFGVQRNI